MRSKNVRSKTTHENNEYERLFRKQYTFLDHDRRELILVGKRKCRDVEQEKEQKKKQALHRHELDNVTNVSWNRHSYPC